MILIVSSERDHSTNNVIKHLLINNVRFLRLGEQQFIDDIFIELSDNALNIKIRAKGVEVDFSEVKTLPWKTDDQGNAVLWPPCNDVMAKFGYGNVDDGEWWGKNGMNPPTLWIVSGAMDILPNVSVSKHQKQLAKEILNDAIHGVTNIWSDETMNEIGVLMHSAEFWSHRGADA